MPKRHEYRLQRYNGGEHCFVDLHQIARVEQGPAHAAVDFGADFRVVEVLLGQVEIRFRDRNRRIRFRLIADDLIERFRADGSIGQHRFAPLQIGI